MAWWVLSLGVAAGLISVILCGLVRAVSLRVGLVDRAGSEPHKRALMPGRTAVPNTGGVAVFVAVAWPVLSVLLGVWLVPEGAWPAAVREHLAGLRATSGLGGGLLAGLAVVHVMGVVDDRRALGAWPKLAVQLAVAGGLAWFGDVRVLTLLGDPDVGFGVAGVVASVGVSTLWLAVIVNAMNFLDNMDGLAAGVGAVAAAIFLAATLIGGQWFVAALAAVLLGALLGFLVWNLPPARLYLGDGGSLVVGLLLGVIAARATYVAPTAGIDPGDGGGLTAAWDLALYLPGVLVPVVVLAVPLYDFVSVTGMRLLQGKSPFVGDHQHFSHRLRRRGLTTRGALAVILLATLATGLGGVMLARLEGWQAALVGGQTLAVLGVLALLESGGRPRPRN